MREPPSPSPTRFIETNGSTLSPMILVACRLLNLSFFLQVFTCNSNAFPPFFSFENHPTSPYHLVMNHLIDLRMNKDEDPTRLVAICTA